MDTTEDLKVTANGAPESETRPEPRAKIIDLPVDATKEPVEIILDHPTDFDGVHYDRLVFNFHKLKRKDWKAIRETFRGINSGGWNPFPIDDEDYQMVVAAEAARVPLLLFDELEPVDWLRVAGATFGFLGKCSDPRLTRPK